MIRAVSRVCVAAVLLAGTAAVAPELFAAPGGTAPGQGGSGWGANASHLRGQNGKRFAYTCPAGGGAGTVWGSGTYTDDSSVCTAAVHAGLITLAGGGTVTIEIRPGLPSYTGSTRNGSTPWCIPMPRRADCGSSARF